MVPCKFLHVVLLNNENLRQERTEKKLLFDSGGDTKACQKTSTIKKSLIDKVIAACQHFPIAYLPSVIYMCNVLHRILSG